jgi:hypothetical protein
MPNGKPAGMRCVQLTTSNACALFGRPERPAVCRQLRPEPGMCGIDAGEAMSLLGDLERQTAPA